MKKTIITMFLIATFAVGRAQNKQDSIRFRAITPLEADSLIQSLTRGISTIDQSDIKAAERIPSKAQLEWAYRFIFRIVDQPKTKPKKATNP